MRDGQQPFYSVLEQNANHWEAVEHKRSHYCHGKQSPHPKQPYDPSPRH
jgi:hypothetical protein